MHPWLVDSEEKEREKVSQVGGNPSMNSNIKVISFTQTVKDRYARNNQGIISQPLCVEMSPTAQNPLFSIFYPSAWQDAWVGFEPMPFS